MSFSPTDDHEPPRLTPAVLWLIALNVAVFFVQLTLQQDLPQYLGFAAGEVGARPWTAGTYMFAHAGFWHLAMNMYTLWAFGPRLERAWSTRQFGTFYLWCGIGGLAAHALLVRDGGTLVGASAAVFGLLYAYARRWPDDEVLLFGVVPMKVRWLVGLLVAVNLVMGMLAMGQGGGGVAYLAHLGGVAFGWLWFRRPAAPNVERLRQRVAPAPDVSDEPPRAVPKTLPRPRERVSETDEVVEKSKALTAKPQPVRPTAPARPVAAAAPAPRSAALDLVLDKISEHGLSSLTTEERRVLEEESEKLRSR